ncbi:MAG: hypothetical protein LBP67_01330 [Bacteroidales bacterium]|jgi:hypothetical protein|nr:hypothetical protein [Bacteroidales bacterium]
MKKTFLLLILLSFFLSSEAQNISVTFKVNNAAGKHLYLTKYSDYITEMEEVVFSSIIPENGIIKHEFKAENTEAYKILIDYADVQIYLQPNTSYTITITYPKIISNINPFQNRQYLEINISSSNNHDVNRLISDFNEEYDDFLLDKLYFQSPRNMLSEHEKFKNEYLKKINKNVDDFFTIYVEYSFGLTEISLVDKIGKNFIDKYFTDKDVAYNSHEYFLLLKDVCKHTEYILNDSTLNNPRLKEVTYLYFLMMDFYGDYDKDEVLNLIKGFISKTKYLETKLIGNNILTYLTRYRKGSSLPALNLESENGNSYDILQSGKNMYLLFVNSDIEICADIIKEIETVDMESFGVIPLLISLDFSKTKINSDKLTLLKPADVGKVHLDLNIRNYPFAILIDKDGKILRYNAPVTKDRFIEVLKEEKSKN